MNGPQGSRRAISATEVSERDKVQLPIPRVDQAASSACVTAQSPSPVVAFTRLLSHQHLRSLDPAALQSALPALVVLARRGTALLCLASDQDVRESVHAAVSSTATLSLHAPPALQFVKMAPRATPSHAAAIQPPPTLPHAASGCVYLQVVQVTGHWQDQSQQPLSSSQDPSGSGGEVPALAEAARSLRRVLGCSAQARAAVTAMAADWERGSELVVVIQPGGTGRGSNGGG